MHVSQLNDDQVYLVILSVAARETHWTKGRTLKRNWTSAQIQKLGETSPILPGYSMVECEDAVFIGVRAFEGDPQLHSSYGAKYVSADSTASTHRTDLGHVIVPLPGSQPKKRRQPTADTIPDTKASLIDDLKTGARELMSTLHLTP